MSKSKIQWTDRVWNPVTGCAKASEGCRHCYAERVAGRFWEGRKFSEIQCHEDRIHLPKGWKKPAKIFVNSMSDLFHAEVPEAFIFRVFDSMTCTPQHTFQVLTKRAVRMKKVVSAYVDQMGMMPNVWLGVSVENQKAADERIPHLIRTPAAIRWLSCEPLLGHVNLPYITGLDWIVVGGESGPSARPMHLDWARSLRDQAGRIPLFFKQWGEWGPSPDGGMIRVGKRQAGDLLDGKQHHEWPAPSPVQSEGDE